MTIKQRNELIAAVSALLEKMIPVEDECPAITVSKPALPEMLTIKECAALVSGLTEHTVRMDYNSIVELAKKELAAEHDTAAKDDEIYRLNEILQALNKEKALWADERSGLHKTIDKLRSQVRGLTDQLSALKAKYERVMEFIEKFDLKEKLDHFLHPINNRKKSR